MFVMLARLKCSKIRSRPRQLIAYSPRGLSRSLSRDPRLETWHRPYTLPVENAAILLSRYLSPTSPGKKLFMAQVSDSCPVDPNFIPAMYTTFAASGSFESDAR